jgi:rhodanese-related sulfurtransferase
MPYRNVNPTEAKALLDGNEGWVYVDVRTEGEFNQGHAAGACNIPVAVGHPPQMTMNPEFLAVVKANFKKGQKLVLACAAGGRSSKACEILVNAGYTDLVNMMGGLSGARDPMGRVEKGWAALGFPTETTTANGKSYEALRRNV